MDCLKQIVFFIVTVYRRIMEILGQLWQWLDKQSDALGVVLTVAGLLLTVLIYKKTKKSDNIKQLAPLPKLPQLFCNLYQQENNWRFATLTIEIDSVVENTVSPVKFTLKRVKSWQFKMNKTAATLNEWPDSNDGSLCIPPNEGEFLTQHLVFNQLNDAFRCEIKLRTNDKISDKFHMDFDGVFAYLLELEFEIQGYAKEKLFVIPLLYGGYSGVTLSSGPSLADLKNQIKSFREIKQIVNAGAKASQIAHNSLNDYILTLEDIAQKAEIE